MLLYKLVIFIFFINFLYPQQEDVIASINVIEGECYLKNNRINLQYKKALPGRNVYSGDIIKTSDNSFCSIYFNDNKTIFTIGPNSSAQIFDDDLTREINIKQGDIYIKNIHNSNKKVYLFTSINQFFIDHDRVWLSADYILGDKIFSLDKPIQLSSIPGNSIFTANDKKVYEINNEGIFFENYDLSLIPDYVELEMKNNTEYEDYEIELRKDDLIPIYGNRIYNTYLNNIFSLSFGLGANAFDDTTYIRLGMYPQYNKKNIYINMKLETFINTNGDDFSEHWNDFFDILDKTSAKIRHSRNKNELFFRFGQNINNVKFGQGYLLNNLNKSIGSPKFQSSGLHFKYLFDKDFMDLNIVIPNLRDFSNSGGLIGARTSLFISHKFPLTLGFGIVADLNQFSTLSNQLNKKFQKKRSVYAAEFDFNYDFISNLDIELSLFGEFVGIWLPQYTYYVLSDDNVLSDDLRWRKGVWGMNAPGIKLKFNNRYEMKFSLNYNAATFLPNYFNSAYLYNKSRYYVNDDLTYPLVQKQIELIEENFSVDGSSNEYFIPKDVYPILFNNAGFSTYNVFGFTTEHSYALYDFLDVSVLASLFVEDSDESNQYYSFETSILINENFIKNLSFLDIYYSNTFFDTFLDNSRLVSGISIGINLPVRLTLIINLSQVYYDSNLLDNNIDGMANSSLGLKYNF